MTAPGRTRTPSRRSQENRAPALGTIRRRPTVARRIGTLLLLMVLGVSLLTSVPALRPVAHTIHHISPIWIAVAIALELASDISFVILFRLFFDRLSGRNARALAWTEQASGALIPGGGVGGLAVGGWLIHLTGESTPWILRRSGGLFFLTTAVNSASMIIAGLLLSLHVAQPHRFTLTALPAVLALALTLPVAALPRILRSHPHTPRWVSGISDGVLDAEQTTFRRTHWRLLGSVGYLACDMAVLWTTLHAVGEPISIPALILAYNIGYVANALPVPGGIGVLDAGLAGALLLYGASPAHVTAAVLVYHAIALWVPGLGGTLAYLRVRAQLTPSPPTDPPEELHHDVSRSPRPSIDPPRLGDIPHRRPPTRPLPRPMRPHPGTPPPRTG